MGNPDATANAIKELTKEIKKQNKLLENLTEAVKNSNNYISIPETYDPYPRDPIINPPYTFTCKDTSITANPPYYGSKVDTTGYGGIGAEWTCADSLEVTH